MRNISLSTTQTKTVALQAYYTDAEELNDLMISLLGDVSNKSVLEPCVGKGAFVRPLLNRASLIEAIDIDPDHTEEVQAFGSANVHVQTGDFIDYFVSDDLFQSIELTGEYDALICNPPYGLKFSIDYRKKIKRKFPEVYARESYGLFMTFGISMLRQGGRFVFIVPDTFLTSRNHAPLRRFLAKETNLSHMVQFDSSRFETVNFGYGSMCILAGNRQSEGQSGNLSWLDLRNKSESISLEAFDLAGKLSSSTLRGAAETGWTHASEEGLTFQCETIALGDLAECRTGIYTGDNTRFCGFDEVKPPRRVNGHPISWDCVLDGCGLSPSQQKDGIDNGRHYVPFIRGGHRLPYEQTASALNWSRDAVDYYRADKKARLQNAAFYFRRGLAVPMVTSGRLSASAFEGAVFDQGVVGVFPHDDSLVEFLLVFLNSDQATALKKAINPTANNSANYIKRIQVPVPDEKQRARASEICTMWKADGELTKDRCREMATSFVEKTFPTT